MDLRHFALSSVYRSKQEVSMKSAVIRQAVREQYGAIARAGATSSGCCAPGCCSPAQDARELSAELGYAAVELDRVPTGANLGLGCGNPQAIAALRPGEVVLDLGSGAGFDAFLAARAVGETGSVIGVDMTPEMVDHARKNAARDGISNVDFRLGEIESLPVADGSVDVILSNCVINLSPDKGAVIREAFRVLKSGGRLAISDVVARGLMPEALRADAASISACVGGAETVQVLTELLEAAGFQDVRIAPKDESASFISTWIPGTNAADWIVSATIEGVRP